MSSTADKVRTNSQVAFCYGIIDMDTLVSVSQQKLTFIISVLTLSAV